MLAPEVFKIVVDSTPLVSIDLIPFHEGKILLGRRKNEPAKGFFFTSGGRIFKKETILAAQKRIVKEELGLNDLPSQPHFIGIFEHFYEKSPFEGVGTHYVNLAYRLDLSEPCHPPTVQHDEYIWLEIDRLLACENVHPYVKLYFKKDHHWQTKK